MNPEAVGEVLQLHNTAAIDWEAPLLHPSLPIDSARLARAHWPDSCFPYSVIDLMNVIHPPFIGGGT